MRETIKKYLILFVCWVFAVLPLLILAQEKSDSIPKSETKLTLNYLCTSNDTVILTANLSIKKENEVFVLEGASVEFLASSGSKVKALGKVITNEEGTAVLTVPLIDMPSDNDGVIIYNSKFNGTEKYTASEAFFAAKPAKIKLSFSIQDSLRFIKIDASQKNIRSEEVPLSKETVILYVPRLFSLLKIGEITLDDDGSGSLEFPNNIIGDTLGNLNILARIEENERYGFVQGQHLINWGVPKQYYKAEVPSRELWTPIAPLWMIITLIIMLAGVWAHYIYAVYELIMIKHHNKKDKLSF